MNVEDDYSWPSCSENGCRAPACAIHLTSHWQNGGGGLMEHGIDPDPAAWFYCRRHGLSSSEHRRWFYIRDTEETGYTMTEHVKEKDWGPMFLDWLQRNWPRVHLSHSEMKVDVQWNAPR